jgi:hypothetical protein
MAKIKKANKMFAFGRGGCEKFVVGADGLEPPTYVV